MAISVEHVHSNLPFAAVKKGPTADKTEYLTRLPHGL